MMFSFLNLVAEMLEKCMCFFHLDHHPTRSFRDFVTLKGHEIHSSCSCKPVNQLLAWTGDSLASGYIFLEHRVDHLKVHIWEGCGLASWVDWCYLWKGGQLWEKGWSSEAQLELVCSCYWGQRDCHILLTWKTFHSADFLLLSWAGLCLLFWWLWVIKTVEEAVVS